MPGPIPNAEPWLCATVQQLPGTCPAALATLTRPPSTNYVAHPEIQKPAGQI